MHPRNAAWVALTPASRWQLHGIRGVTRAYDEGSMRALVLFVALVAASCRNSPAGTAPAHDAAIPPVQAPVAAPAPLPPEPEPCEPPAPTATTGERLTLLPVAWKKLPGWTADRQSAAVPAFLASCTVLAKLGDDERVGAGPYGGTAGDWRAACAAAARVPAGDDAAARAFFEAEFRAYAAHGSDGAKAKLSGYYVQPLRGSRQRGGRYRTPVLARPPDLVEVQLSDFIPDGRDRRIWGRVGEHGELESYPTRTEIRQHPDRYPVLLWVDDPVDEIFAEIEGSGRVTLADGSTLWIGFDGKNGHRYHGVGGILRRMGLLKRGQGTMQGIRAWFAAHPGRVDEIADHSPSKVFFRELPAKGAVGTQGVVLTARRSIAVDRAVIPLSTPVWVATRAPVAGKRGTVPWRQLLIAQDTGGAILGPVRGDVYWGDDAAAGDVAGRMGGPGRMWLLLPRAVKLPSK